MPFSADSRFTSATELLSRAYAFAADAHEGRRHEAHGSPYIEHSLAVGRLLYLAGCREEVVAAGLLHATVERTDARVEDIERRFGREVSKLVAATTEPAGVEPVGAREDALRRQVIAAGHEAEAVFAADKVVNERPANQHDEKVEHYRTTLPLVPLLREELDQIAGAIARED